MRQIALVFMVFSLLQACSTVSSDQKELKRSWKSAHFKDHVLVGRWYDSNTRNFVQRDHVDAAVLSADVVLLGEKHDNPDHHDIQAEFVNLGSAGDVVLLEMLVQEQALAASRLSVAQSLEEMASMLAWDKNWSPDIRAYGNILINALDNDMSIMPANAARQRVREVIGQGLNGEDAAFVKAWFLDKPLPDGGQASLEQQIRDVHCGYLPEKHVPAMAMAQRLRDVVMADSILRADGGRKFVITGNGHARRDRAIPALLSGRGSGHVLSIALVEVQDTLLEPEKYAEIWGTENLPFDYILFTPVVDPVDPCEKFRHQFSNQPG